MVTKKKIPACMSGRPNLYVEFIYKCFTEHLAPGGILSFVLPTSFLNSSYYEPMRRILSDKGEILAVKELDGGFFDTTQATFILVVRSCPQGQCQAKEKTKSPYILDIAGNLYLNPQANRIREILEGSQSLKSLGLSVKTGSVVWNQVSHIEGVKRDITAQVQEGNLVAQSDGATMLYYSSNLARGQPVPMKDDTLKKQYIKGFCREAQRGPAILVSRGYGNNYLFSYAVIPDGRAFYAENHVNVISGPEMGAKIGRIVLSLENKKTAEFLRLFVGNGGLSKSELEDVLPVF
jgi:hypothetical protein